MPHAVKLFVLLFAVAQIAGFLLVPSVARSSPSREAAFVFHGRPLVPGSSLYRIYVGSMQRFPDLSSCLSDGEGSNNLNINWRNMGSSQDADVCLFHVFSALPDDEEMMRWLRRAGFSKVTAIRRGFGLPMSSDKSAVDMQAIWTTAEKGPLYGGFFERIAVGILDTPVSVSISLNKDSDVIDVNFGYKSD